MKLYTKTGDSGFSSLFGGRRISKADLRLEAYGTVDELNACLGVVLALPGAERYQAALEEVQSDLFSLGSELAAPENPPSGFTPLAETRVADFEKAMDDAEGKLPELKSFILPGGNQVAVALHVARTVARRAERAVVRLQAKETVRPFLVTYLNRLSDYLFSLARCANAQLPHGREVTWHGSKS